MIADECRIMAKHVQARRVIILHIIVLQTTTVKKKSLVQYSTPQIAPSNQNPRPQTRTGKTTARVLAVKKIVL